MDRILRRAIFAGPGTGGPGHATCGPSPDRCGFRNSSFPCRKVDDRPHWGPRRAAIAAMEPAQLDRTPFAVLDAMPPDMFAMLVAALEGMSRHPEIRRVRDTAWQALRPASGQRLLDAGCGAGDVARALAAAVAPGGEVVALDY